jgi:DNA-binding MarR family transcriptional regulator
MYLNAMAGPVAQDRLSVSIVTINFVTINGIAMANSVETSDNISLQLEAFLPYRLVSAAEAVSLDFSHVYNSKHGLSRPEWRVLATLAQYGRTTATVIGAHAAMHKTKVSRAVFALEARKWLMRSSDDKDRRIEWLELTRTGKSRFATLAKLALDYEARLLHALGKENAMQLLNALAKLEHVPLPNAKRASNKNYMLESPPR